MCLYFKYFIGKGTYVTRYYKLSINHILNSIFPLNLNIALLNLLMYFTYTDRKRHICDPLLQTQPLFLMSSISNFRKHGTQGEISNFIDLKFLKTWCTRRKLWVLQSEVPKNSVRSVKFHSSSFSSAQKLFTDGEIS